MEKSESFKAKMVEHKKILKERRGAMVRLQASVKQREAEVSQSQFQDVNFTWVAQEVLLF